MMTFQIGSFFCNSLFLFVNSQPYVTTEIFDGFTIIIYIPGYSQMEYIYFLSKVDAMLKAE